MKFKYLIQKKTDNEWVDQDEMGLFDSIDDANYQIYIVIENKREFWTRYKVVQCIVK
jgi:hypothetical protein